MKIVNFTITFSFLLFVAVTCTMAAEISGTVVKGLRILTQEEVQSKVITLYRGDYVVFPASEAERKTLVVAGLKIKHVFPAEKGKKNYVKFKQTGLYEFDYGNVKGEIKVIEYTQANYQAVDAREAREIITNISPLLLDVRTPAERDKQGFIENSILIPVQVIQRDYIKLIDSPNRPILIYCATGNRSTVAARILSKKGFKNIYNMRYGMKEWKKRGYPVTRGEPKNEGNK